MPDPSTDTPIRVAPLPEQASWQRYVAPNLTNANNYLLSARLEVSMTTTATLEARIASLVASAPALRSSYDDDGTLVGGSTPLAQIRVIDVRDIRDGGVEPLIQRIATQTAARVSAKHMPAAFVILRRSSNDHVVLAIIHHLAVDLYSMSLIAEAIVSGKPRSLDDFAGAVDSVNSLKEHPFVREAAAVWSAVDPGELATLPRRPRHETTTLRLQPTYFSITRVPWLEGSRRGVTGQSVLTAAGLALADHFGGFVPAQMIHNGRLVHWRGRAVSPMGGRRAQTIGMFASTGTVLLGARGEHVSERLGLCYASAILTASAASPLGQGLEFLTDHAAWVNVTESADSFESESDVPVVEEREPSHTEGYGLLVDYANAGIELALQLALAKDCLRVEVSGHGSAYSPSHLLEISKNLVARLREHVYGQAERA